MNRIKIIFLIISLLFPVFSSAQVQSTTLDNITYTLRELNIFYDDYVMNKTLAGDSSDLSGTPYLNPLFIEGEILTGDNRTFIDIPLRYNVYNDNFEFRRNEENLMLDPDKFARQVTIEDHLFVYTNFPVTGGSKKGYLELLAEGNVKLYKKYRIIYDPPKPAIPYQDAIPGTFKEVSPDYFIRVGEGKLNGISSEKALLEIFSERREEIKSFIKKEKIKIRKEEDFVELVKYLNY